MSPKRIPGLWKKATPPVRLAWLYLILMILSILAVIVWGVTHLVSVIAA